MLSDKIADTKFVSFITLGIQIVLMNISVEFKKWKNQGTRIALSGSIFPEKKRGINCLKTLFMAGFP